MAISFELMENNLYDIISNEKIKLPSINNIKYIIFNTFKALNYMHKKGIYHRDIKPENILIKNNIIKLADFGCCKGVFSDIPCTEYISTRWYRPPECLLTDGFYDSKIDIWGMGCVLYEMITTDPLFPGDNELDQINLIHEILGTPDQEILDYYQKLASHIKFDFKYIRGKGLEYLLGNTDPLLIDLLYKLLAYEPCNRITAGDALHHEWFKDIFNKELTLKLSNKKVYKKKENKESKILLFINKNDKNGRIYKSKINKINNTNKSVKNNFKITNLTNFKGLQGIKYK